MRSNLHLSIISDSFEPFAAKDASGGFGMDLSAVYGIVQEHGGDVGISSEEGRGTAVTVLLPALAEE